MDPATPRHARRRHVRQHFACPRGRAGRSMRTWEAGLAPKRYQFNDSRALA